MKHQNGIRIVKAKEVVAGSAIYMIGRAANFRQEISNQSNFRQNLHQSNFRQKDGDPSIFRQHRKMGKYTKQYSNGQWAIKGI